jgi:hypothetical protein
MTQCGTTASKPQPTQPHQVHNRYVDSFQKGVAISRAVFSANGIVNRRKGSQIAVKFRRENGFAPRLVRLEVLSVVGTDHFARSFKSSSSRCYLMLSSCKHDVVRANSLHTARKLKLRRDVSTRLLIASVSSVISVTFKD